MHNLEFDSPSGACFLFVPVSSMSCIACTAWSVILPVVCAFYLSWSPMILILDTEQSVFSYTLTHNKCVCLCVLICVCAHFVYFGILTQPQVTSYKPHNPLYNTPFSQNKHFVRISEMSV